MKVLKKLTTTKQHLDPQVSYTTKTMEKGKWAKLQHNNDTLNTGGDRQYMWHNRGSRKCFRKCIDNVYTYSGLVFYQFTLWRSGPPPFLSFNVHVPIPYPRRWHFLLYKFTLSCILSLRISWKRESNISSWSDGDSGWIGENRSKKN